MAEWIMILILSWPESSEPPSLRSRLQRDKSGVYLLKKMGSSKREQRGPEGKSRENQYGSYGGVASDWSFSTSFWDPSVSSGHNLYPSVTMKIILKPIILLKSWKNVAEDEGWRMNNYFF